MKPKHLTAHIKMCLVLSELSECPRRKFGALLIDPERNTILATGYNGGPRGQTGGDLCAGATCERDDLCIPSGTHMERGCIHAEQNIVCNAAAQGTKTAGAWLIITGECCRACSKLIHHAGITKVICVKGGYAGGSDGITYLLDHGVQLEYVDGPQDPRTTI